jgi:uncharacterized protein YcgI (DUF1989 family)
MKVLQQQDLPGRGGGAWVVRAGQYIRITDVDGGAIGDFVCFDAKDKRDRFSQARTKANQGKILLSVGDKLYTRDNNVLLEIVEDTYGVHDLQYGMCSAWVYQNFRDKDYHGFDKGRMKVGGPMGVPPFGCYEVIQNALKGRDIAPEDIPDPLNLFQTVDIDGKTGRMAIVDGRSKPGDYVTFKAHRDTLCALSACPSMGRPLKVEVYEA